MSGHVPESARHWLNNVSPRRDPLSIAVLLSSSFTGQLKGSHLGPGTCMLTR